MVALGVLIFLGTLGPQLWVRWVFWRYGKERPDLPCTGGELAHRLLDHHGMHDVRVEEIAAGDHYDPLQKVIRLARSNYRSRSLTGLVTAAHEFGHALQDHKGYGPLRFRTQVMAANLILERLGSAALLGSGLIALISPALSRPLLMAGAFGMLAGVPARFVTLPVEFDASYQRALPLLDEHNVLGKRDMLAARRILSACALTYVAGALASLLSIRRWLRILTRR